VSALTIVMYHYVRDLAHSRYPAIKGRTLEEFEGQLDYITRHYTVCSTRDVIAAARGERALPVNACVLTFDDGLLDHFTVVLPRLLARGLTASFYPPAVTAAQTSVLDTHKIHFILAAATDHEALARRLRALIDARRGEPGVASSEALWEQSSQRQAWDFDSPAEVVFVKRALQRDLPPPVRAAITATLFEEFVGVDECAFARELYMDTDQLRRLVAQGMEVGGHGAAHVWLNTLSLAEQQAEIDATAAFLADVHGRRAVDWVMSYPFGAYTFETLALLPRAGCALGLTTRFAAASDLSSPLELPRLDTNHLPLRGDAPAPGSTAEPAGIREERRPVRPGR
jgi:peptidoglycan/xylan/chitin deacetylase (PgdA/CDA1 family)